MDLLVQRDPKGKTAAGRLVFLYMQAGTGTIKETQPVVDVIQSNRRAGIIIIGLGTEICVKFCRFFFRHAYTIIIDGEKDT